MSKVASSDPPGVSNAKITAEKVEEEDDSAEGEVDCRAVEISSAVPDEMKSLTSTQRTARSPSPLSGCCCANTALGAAKTVTRTLKPNRVTTEIVTRRRIVQC